MSDPALGARPFDRESADYYPTIDKRCLAGLHQHFSLRRKNVLDPAAGSGHLLDQALELGAKSAIGIELHPEVKALVNHPLVQMGSLLHLDPYLLRHKPYKRVSMIVTNLPYSEIDPLTEHLVGVIEGMYRPLVFASLARTDWMAGKTRARLFSRPSFAGVVILRGRPWWRERNADEKSPRFNYAWYVWASGDNPAPRILFSDLKGRNDGR